MTLAAACALGAWASDASASSRVLFGIQDDAWLEYGPGTLSSRVAEIDRIGLDVVRVTVDWHRTEPRPGEYRWARTDRLLGAIHRRGLLPLVTIYGAPGWANGGQGPNVAPLRGEPMYRFARALSNRYRYVRHWAIWNEPNLALWLRPVSARTYVNTILNPAYRGIKEVLPGARVAGGVTAPRGGANGVSPVDFLRAMGRSGARLDAFAHHPYPVYQGDTPFTGGCDCKTITMATLERLVRLVDDVFPHARIWFTEYGYQTNPPDPFGVPLLEQARFVGKAARRVYAAPKVDMLIHYLYRDEPDVDRWQSGLQMANGREKPSLAAMALPLAQVSRKGVQTTVWGQVRPGAGAQRYMLQRLVGGRWVALGGVRTTDARGYLLRTVLAPKGTRLRLWYPARGTASPALTVL